MACAVRRDRARPSRLHLVAVACAMLLACGGDDGDGDDPTGPEGRTSEYRDRMRSLVQDIAAYARQVDGDFIVILQASVSIGLEDRAHADHAERCQLG